MFMYIVYQQEEINIFKITLKNIKDINTSET